MFALDGKTHENRKKCEKLKCFRKEGKNLAKKRKEKSGTGGRCHRSRMREDEKKKTNPNSWNDKLYGTQTR